MRSPTHFAQHYPVDNSKERFIYSNRDDTRHGSMSASSRALIPILSCGMHFDLVVDQAPVVDSLVVDVRDKPIHDRGGT